MPPTSPASCSPPVRLAEVNPAAGERLRCRLRVACRRQSRCCWQARLPAPRSRIRALAAGDRVDRDRHRLCRAGARHQVADACMPAASYFLVSRHRRGVAVRGRTRHTPLRPRPAWPRGCCCLLRSADQRDRRPPDPAIFHLDRPSPGWCRGGQNWVLALLLAAIIGLVVRMRRVSRRCAVPDGLAILPAVVAGSALTRVGGPLGTDAEPARSIAAPAGNAAPRVRLAAARSCCSRRADRRPATTLGGGGSAGAIARLTPRHARESCCSQMVTRVIRGMAHRAGRRQP